MKTKKLSYEFSMEEIEMKKHDLFCSGFPNAIVVMRSNTAAAVVIWNERNNIPSIHFDGSIEDMTYYLLTRITCIRIQNIEKPLVMYNDTEYDK